MSAPAPVSTDTATFAVEVHGINPIPAEERWARPRDVFGLIFGGANSISTAVLGTFAVVFGLTFWDGVIAIVLGVLLGSLILAPMVLFGPRNGTNNAVSSSAHFGAHGRLIGSLLALLGAFTFLALAVWASGDAMLASVARLVGFEVNGALSAGVYVLMALLLIVICVYGYKLLVVLNRIVPPLVAMLFVVGIVIYAMQRDFGEALAYDVAGRWSDPLYIGGFIGTMLIAMSCPISYGPFLGDYSRYVADSGNRRSLLAAVILAQLACLGAFLFGHVTASVIAVSNPELIMSGDYVGGLVASTTVWFFIPLALISVAGGVTTGTSLLYGTGLDFSSIVVVMNRVASTVLIGGITVAFVLIGKFVFDMVQSVTTLSTLLVVCTVPWIAIMLIGYLTRRGWYDVDSLLVFSRRQVGGKYWFQHGWNVNAVASWLIGAVLAVSFVNLPGQFVGPLGNTVGGIDVSLLVALTIPALLFWILLRVNPDPDYVFGPEGARGVPVRAGELEPVISNPRA
ncbi:purine-cytosine permease family protein [Leucobacter tenebrionis]|uniref:purine-cytosine permease family protein n=1 Tax=Leucobacter tenebrionis TaxID=2873270 RepID=UPI001CA769F1|nr:cytosine permease [Leucobacter tenebrionis]QZY51343.1 cytosine permease [Leucobacter tenebrionis]